MSLAQTYATFDDVTILQRLVELCQNLLAMRVPSDPEHVVALINEVSRRQERPAPDGRVFETYTTLTASAVAEAACALQDHRPELAQVYFQLIGVALPSVRKDLSRAFEIRKRPTA